MDYIYDILLNFNEDLIEFFEWDDNDNIKYIKKIMLFKVDEQTVKDIVNNTILLSLNFTNSIPKYEINNIKEKCKLCLLTDGNIVIGLLIENNVVKYISRLLLDEEYEILLSLDSLDNIPVEVDISGLNEDKTYDVIISKPAGIKELSTTNAKVTIRLGTEITKEIEDIHIETINLNPNYKAVAIGENSSKTTVVVKGTKNVLDSIDSTMITAKVDLKDYTEGEREATVKVEGTDNRATYTSKTTKIKVRITKK